MAAILATPADTPIKLAIDFWDIDETYPSLKLSIELVAPHPTGQYVYSANDIWFSDRAIENFVASLTLVADARDSTASLSDLSDYFQLTLIHADSEYSMNIRAHEPNTGLITADMSITCTIDRDIVQFMVAAFRQLPRLQSKTAK